MRHDKDTWAKKTVVLFEKHPEIRVRWCEVWDFQESSKRGEMKITGQDLDPGHGSCMGSQCTLLCVLYYFF